MKKIKELTSERFINLLKIYISEREKIRPESETIINEIKKLINEKSSISEELIKKLKNNIEISTNTINKIITLEKNINNLDYTNEPQKTGEKTININSKIKDEEILENNIPDKKEEKQIEKEVKKDKNNNNIEKKNDKQEIKRLDNNILQSIDKEVKNKNNMIENNNKEKKDKLEKNETNKIDIQDNEIKLIKEKEEKEINILKQNININSYINKNTNENKSCGSSYSEKIIDNKEGIDLTIKKKIKLDISTQQSEEENINNSLITSFLKKNDEEKIIKIIINEYTLKIEEKEFFEERNFILTSESIDRLSKIYF